MPFRAMVYRLVGQCDAGLFIAGHGGNPGQDAAKVRRRMQLAGVLGDLHALVRSAQRLPESPGYERRLRVLQQDVWQAADHAALSGLDEHPLGLGPRFVGVADDHRQERAVDG
jgi:hypothetical protein